MHKKDLIERLVAQTGLSRERSRLALDAVLECVAEALQRQERVSLIGFGSFEVRKRSGRKYRHPATGKVMHLRARNWPTFKPGKRLREAVRPIRRR